MTAGPGPLDTERIAALLSAAPDALAAELRGLGRDGARWRPATDEWSFVEVVGHLIEAERRGFAGRIRAIVGSPEPQVALASWDQEAVAAARDDRRTDPTTLLAEFRALRLDGISLVRGLDAADLGRTGAHPVIGVVRVDELLAEWVHHDRAHLRQALDAAQAWSWAQMGATRRFSDPTA
jgi:hypothetical protein